MGPTAKAIRAAEQFLSHNQEKTMLTTVLGLIVFAGTTAAESQTHALILARTSSEKTFVRDAAMMLVERKLTPITLDELNALLESERVKDLIGCSTAICITEIAGAFGVRYIAIIKPNAQGSRAMISVHDTNNMGKLVVERVVSRDSAVNALLASVDDFNTKRDKLYSTLAMIPCGYPWVELRDAIGPPHTTTHNGYIQGYYDFEIHVVSDLITLIKEGRTGKLIMACH